MTTTIHCLSIDCPERDGKSLCWHDPRSPVYKGPHGEQCDCDYCLQSASQWEQEFRKEFGSTGWTERPENGGKQLMENATVDEAIAFIRQQLIQQLIQARQECKEKLAHLENYYKKFARMKYEHGRQEERERIRDEAQRMKSQEVGAQARGWNDALDEIIFLTKP